MTELIEGLKQVTSQVSDVKIDISIRRRVGDLMGDIENTTRVLPKEAAIESILEKESEELSEHQVEE